MRQPPFPRLAAAVGLALAAGFAHADSSASFQVTSFDWTTAGTLAWSPTDAYQSLTATAQDAGGLADFASNNTTVYDLGAQSQGAGTAHGSAAGWSLGNQTIGGQSSASASSFSPSAQPNSGVAQVVAGDWFTLSGADTVTFNLGYTMAVAATPGDPHDSYAESSLVFGAGSLLGTSGGTTTLDHYSFDQATGQGLYTGTLSFTVTLAGADDVGYYNLAGNAISFAPAAPVPEPASGALMLAGLGALLTAAHRRRRA